jgi:hypothetical protein
VVCRCWCPSPHHNSAAPLSPLASSPLKPPGWTETSPLSPLHDERHPLHAPSPLDQRITLFSSSSGCRNPPRSSPVTTRLLCRRTPSPVFSFAASSTPGHLGEPPPSSPGQAPPSFTTGASLGYPTAFHPLLGRHRPCHGAGRACGDHVASVPRGADWHGPAWLIVAKGWAGR